MPSKDQRTVDTNESPRDKWNRAKSLFLESLHKPDHELRACAHNQKCYNELMEIRDDIITLVEKMMNPRDIGMGDDPEINEMFGIPEKLPEQPPKVDSYIESKSYEYAADITLADIRRFQRGTSL